MTAILMAVSPVWICSKDAQLTRHRGGTQGDAQHLQLARGVEPIARLDLDRGDALAQECVEARARGSEQLVLARRPRRRDGRDDAAAGSRDLLVARALEAQLEFPRPFAGEDEVCVAVD